MTQPTDGCRREILAVLLQVVVMMMASACFGQSAPTKVPDSVHGIWILQSIYPTSNVQGPSSRQQRKLLGSRISISANSLDACRQSVAISSVDVNDVTADQFLTNTRISFEEVQIHAPTVAEVVINRRQSGNCYNAFPLPGQDIYVKGKNELLVDFEGVFYKAIRVRQPG